MNLQFQELFREDVEDYRIAIVLIKAGGLLFTRNCRLFAVPRLRRFLEYGCCLLMLILQSIRRPFLSAARRALLMCRLLLMLLDSLKGALRSRSWCRGSQS